VGNDFRDFSRLIKEVDEIAPNIPDEIVIQTGYSRYCPKNAKAFDFVPVDTAIEYIRMSEIVISHAGIGTIILCREYGIPIIILPRRKKYDEHMNDHQMEIAKMLEERRGPNVHVIYEESQLERKILEVLRNREKRAPIGNVGRLNLIRTIREFIERG
jgi:UDP-N-acetylglucosamine transferase subunit ALG13